MKSFDHLSVLCLDYMRIFEKMHSLIYNNSLLHFKFSLGLMNNYRLLK